MVGRKALKVSRGRRSSYQMQDALEELEKGRNGAVKVKAGSPPFHDRYNKACAVTDAIDDLVEDLTGDREKLWGKPHG